MKWNFDRWTKLEQKQVAQGLGYTVRKLASILSRPKKQKKR